MVVITLASTEPPILDTIDLSSIDSIHRLIDENKIEHIRPSLIYAYAAISLGCAYINFTPSEGGFSQGLVDLALEKGESGIMTHMASFFKSPWGIEEHSLEKQFRLPEEYGIKIAGETL